MYHKKVTTFHIPHSAISSNCTLYTYRLSTMESKNEQTHPQDEDEKNKISNEKPNHNPNEKENSRRRHGSGRKLGRASRRRQTKIRAIRQSVQILLTGGKSTGGKEGEEHVNNIEDENINILPTDRSRSLPGVITRRRQLNHGPNRHGEECNSANMSQMQTEGNGFYKNDETMLTSQLGFIPGNAISVASRVKDIQHIYPRLYQLLLSTPAININIHAKPAGTPIANTQIEQQDHPMVLQLYPLVTRDVYHGGKSDGRKFKSRKRGYSKAIAQESDETQNDDTNNNTGAKDDQKEDKHTQNRTTTIEPFPTMYWLTHPYLRALISQLEIEPTHNVKMMEDKLSSQPNHIQTMKDAHESYGNQRWELLTKEDQQDTIDRKWVDALGMKRGVAGIRNFQTVKCLHTHAAHYLAQLSTKLMKQKGEQKNDGTEIKNDDDDLNSTENLVGRWVLEAVEELILNGGKI